MAAIVITLAVAAYQPMFPGSGYPASSKERRIVPPYKAVYFDAGPQSYTVEWGKGQTVNFALRVPTRLGTFADKTDNTTVSLVLNDCNLPLRGVTSTEVEYDPLFETELVTLALVHGEALRESGKCVINIEAVPEDAPYAIASGTDEALFGTMYGSGFPVNLMFVSAWCKNYIYGYVLITALPATALWHALSPWRLHLAYKSAIMILLATSLSRAWQTTTAGVGAGFFFTLLPLALAGAVCHVSLKPKYSSALVAMAIVVPTRSWVDVMALSAAAAITSQY